MEHTQETIRWDYSGPQVREAVLQLLGWVTKTGHLNPTGRKIQRQSWDTMSPAARNILTRAGIVK